MAATALRSSRTAATTPILDVGGQSALPIEVEGFDMPALARKMWRPMLATGLMAVVAGVIVGIVQAASTNALHVPQLAAWNPGLLFLGVGALLSAVTFLLAVILGSLRDGGAAVQRSLEARALVMKRPLTGKLFPVAMMMGLMLLLAGVAISFVQAARIDTDSASAAEIAAWAGPPSAGRRARSPSTAWSPTCGSTGGGWVSMRTVGQLRDDVNPRLASIACPTLLLSGGAAHGFLRKHEERVGVTIPDVEFALVPHARTTSPFDQSQAYAEIVADFLRREALAPGNPRLRTSPRPASVRDRMRPPPPPATLGP